MDHAELEKRTRQLLMHIDAMDIDAVRAVASPDVQIIDELSRTWLRGVDGLEDYLATVISQLSGVRSDLSDFAVRMHGDTGIVTFTLAQSYIFAGKPYAITAPSTAVYLREHGDWKVALLHSVAIPDT